MIGVSAWGADGGARFHLHQAGTTSKETHGHRTSPPAVRQRRARPAHLRGDARATTTASTTRRTSTNLNGLIEGKPDAEKSLEEIIAAAEPGGLFNNAAQVWNHTFYWNSMRRPAAASRPASSPRRSTRPSARASDFKQQLVDKAKGHFGSGWAWLVKAATASRSSTPPTPRRPIKHGKKPLLTVDVWEHAYYLDYRNTRPDYVEAFLDKLLNWEFAAANYAG